MEAVINNEVKEEKVIQKPSKKREIFIDFFRAVCMLFVMLGHRNILPAGIGIFVLPGFFIASGYTFRAEQGDFKTFIVKKIKRLLIPFWIAMGVMAVVEIIRGPILGYGDFTALVPMGITAVYGSFRNFPAIGSFGQFILDALAYKPQTPGFIDMILPTNCHLWFLPALFSADVVLYFLFKIRKNKVWFDALAITGLLLLAGIETIPNVIQFPYGLGRGFFAAALMIMGFRMKQAELFTSKNLKWQLILLVGAVAISVFSLFAGYDGRAIVRSYYGPCDNNMFGFQSILFVDVFMTFICGLAFAYVVMYVMYWLAKIPENPVSNVLAYAGRNSMDVYLWHMVVYFLGDLFMLYALKATPTPDGFYVECFEGAHLVYRWIIVFVTYAVLLVYVQVKTIIKAKVKKHKQLAAQN